MVLDNLKRRSTLAALASATVLLGACSSQQAPAAREASGPQRLAVSCTISTLCSLVRSVGGDRVTVRGIVPVGVSPETYDPTPEDIVALTNADVLIENGAGLEVWLAKMLSEGANPKLVRVVLADGVPASAIEPGNPHLWLDPHYAAIYVGEIASALTSADPQGAAAYRAGAAAERKRLAALDGWIRAQVATIPSSRRSMICFHDAWRYFDRRYGIRDVGAIEQSPGQEPSPAYFAHLAAQARELRVRAIFGEPQFSPKLADALAANAGITIVSELYDDTLGTTPATSDYEGMMRYDVKTIVGALGP